jgi:hypothetical protein
MDVISPSDTIPFVTAFDISARGRIAASSGWHAAEKRVNGLALMGGEDGAVPLAQPAWPALVRRLGGNLTLANRRAAELKPTLDAVNAIISALNTLQPGARYADLEALLGLRKARETLESHDRIGDAMGRVLRRLERRHAEEAGPSGSP